MVMKYIKSVEGHEGRRSKQQCGSKSKSKSGSKTKGKKVMVHHPSDREEYIINSHPEEIRKIKAKTALGNRLTASQEKFAGKKQQFRRKNNGKDNTRQSKSRKESKRSTDNENE